MRIAFNLDAAFFQEFIDWHSLLAFLAADEHRLIAVTSLAKNDAVGQLLAWVDAMSRPIAVYFADSENVKGYLEEVGVQVDAWIDLDSGFDLVAEAKAKGSRQRPSVEVSKKVDWCHLCKETLEMKFVSFRLDANEEVVVQSRNGYVRLCELCVRDFARHLWGNGGPGT